MAKLYMDSAQEFINYIIKKYDAESENESEDSPVVCYKFSLQKVQPSFPFDMYLHLTIDPKYNKWHCFQTCNFAMSFNDEEYNRKVKELDKLFSEDHVCREPFEKEIEKVIPELFFIETYSNTRLAITYIKDNIQYYGLDYCYDFIKNEIYLEIRGIWSSWKWGGSFSSTLSVEKFEEKLKELKESVLDVNWLDIFEKTQDFIKNFDPNIYKERIHIPVGENTYTIEQLKKSSDYKVEKIPEETKEYVINYLLDNFKENLLNNDLKIINELTADNDFIELHDTNDYALLYEIIKTTLNEDIRHYFNHEKMWCKRYTASTPMIIPEVESVYADSVSNHFIVEEGKNSIPDFYSDRGHIIIISLPKTITIDITPFLHYLEGIYVEYTPIEDEKGNLISPFIINKLQYEHFKDHFIAKK